MVTAEEKSLLGLFEELVPSGQWRELESGSKRAQIYTLPVVVGMMLGQRLSEQGSQQEAVHEMVMGRLNHVLPDSKRVREGKISLNTGGYARACGRVSIGVLEKVCDQLLEELRQRIEPNPELKVPMMLLDGSSLQLEHEPELVEDYPPSRNRYGEAHWGVMKWVTLHDMQTGIALRPAWGPMFGGQ